MEIVTGIKIKDILLDNGNWWKLYLKHHNLIRISIVTNVLKVLTCKTGFLGYHLYACPKCNKTIKAPHSCKSRFCSSCGKKATDDWIKNSFNSLPDTKWQHITFTMPSALWNLFWINRHLMNKVPAIAAGIIKKLANQMGFIPGIFLAIHTFGRDLKRNVHIHLSTTIGGIASTNEKWIASAYFHHDTLKKIWRYEIITLFRNEYKSGRLKLPTTLSHIKTYTAFNLWLNQLYQKTWVVHLNHQSNNFKANVAYLGKYIKRPPIGETRIKAYDGKSVTFQYLDHYTKNTERVTLPALEFIARLIAHVPDRYFRNIRYYGFLANRVRGKFMPIVNRLLKKAEYIKKKIYTPWRNRIMAAFHYDPLKCPVCQTLMQLMHAVFPDNKKPLISMHKEIANGYFPLL